MSCPEEAPAEASLDAFYGGRFHLYQPEGWGFRAGLDALLAAASVPAGRTGAAADLGAGAGALGFALACRCPGLHVTLVEREPRAAALARRSRLLPANAALAGRLGVIEADILARRPAREAAGLADGAYGTIVTNPPFYPAAGRASPDAARAAALVMGPGAFLADWLRTAGALLTGGGLLSLVARPDALAALLAAMAGRFGDVALRPVHPRDGQPAHRILVQARKGSGAPLRIVPALLLHEPSGAPSPLARDIARGLADLSAP